MHYNWQQSDWPNFRFDLEDLHEKLLVIAKKVGFIEGTHSSLPRSLQTEIMINLMVEEAVKTSEIEGEYITRQDVRSSIRNKLGLDFHKVNDQRANGIADILLDLRKTFNDPLTDDQLFDWHLSLLSGSFNPNLLVGRWRESKEPMQVVSGPPGKLKVHFEAPPASKIPHEMQQFIQWFNATAPGSVNVIQYPPVRAAIAHLYFESIHPFDDGNGRIGRAIAEKALLQGFGYPLLISLSQSIEANKKEYYDALKTASRSNEISDWIKYFIELILSAQQETEKEINFIINKTKFFDTFKDQLNERQLKVIKRMMRDMEFEGGMSAKKYMTIAKVSKATATRDLQALLHMKALRQEGSGPSVRYYLYLTLL